MIESSVLENILKRDRLIVVTGLLTIIVLSWVYILNGAGMPAMEMDASMPTMEMTQMAVWGPSYAGIMLLMWSVMMIAMMLPSATPMILIFARVNRSQREKGTPFVPTVVFMAGYLVTWGVFSLLATCLQWGLERAELLSAMMGSNNAVLGGLLLIAAGGYQFTPLKNVCLKNCRNPFQFITHHWRTGTLGAFRMGIDHGVFCLACCWFLMGLLFVGGVMNLYWIVSLTIFVLLEKMVPSGNWLGSITGTGLIIWGGWMILGIL